MSGAGVGAVAATGVALAEASGDGPIEGVALARACIGKANARLKTTKNNRKVSFRMEN